MLLNDAEAPSTLHPKPKQHNIPAAEMVKESALSGDDIIIRHRAIDAILWDSET